MTNGLTKNIKFENFNKKKITNLKKKIKNLKNFDWISHYPLLNSATKKYKYSYSKKFLKKYKKKKLFRVIGMGGSSLGARAIYNFLKLKIKKKFIFIDNLKPLLDTKKNSVNIVISKSGETLETFLNFRLFKKQESNIFITEKKNSLIFNEAQKLKENILEHKNYIGGRYSVLSEVGMLPAELMGLNEKNFKNFNELIKNENFMRNIIKNVENILHFSSKKIYNSVILNYDEKSYYFFRWYQQLVSESLGKKSKGIIPIISSMPQDNHSMLQMYLDGPRNNFYTFFSVINDKSNKVSYKTLNDLNIGIKNLSILDFMLAQKNATKNIFRKKKINFRSFEILNRSEETMGELFCFFILETILLGKTLKVNPFDQPSVELIKRETRRILR